MKPVPLDPETQFSEMLAQVDDALATASDASSVSSQPFVSTLADAHLQQRFDRLHGCLQLLEQDRRRQAASEARLFEQAASAQPASVPHQIGRFLVIRRLGSGGFGVVFLAEDPVLRRNVAIKMPLAGIFQSQNLHDRFLRECRAAAMLNHPGIVRVLESGDVLGIPYQVTEFVNGERLSDLIKRARPSVESAAKIVRSLADAIQHAHDHGVLHRDIKPDNILLQSHQFVAENASPRLAERLHEQPGDLIRRNTPTPGLPVTDMQKTTEASVVGTLQTTRPLDPVPRITDFGLARLADDDSSLSRSGMLVGTPKYMSPEQLHGKIRMQGPPMDIYALGVVLHELLTGAIPFPDADSLQSRMATTGNSVPSFRSVRAGISKDLETICLKCLQLRPEDRYGSAGELRDDLSRYLDGRPTLARPVPVHEQFVRWVAGNRKLAGLLGLLTLLTLVVFVQSIRNERASHQQNAALSLTLSQLTAQKQRAEESLKLAKSSRAEAVQSESRFRDIAWLAQQGEYSAAMMQATSAWQRREIALMNQTLLPFLSRSDDSLREFGWRYLWNQGQTLRPLVGHSESVVELGVADDGEHAWSVGLDNTIRRWHINSGVLKSTWRLEGEGRGIRAAISQNCRRAVISRILDKERKNNVTVWDLETGTVLMGRDFALDETQSVAISRDGSTVLVGGQKRTAENSFIPFVQAWLPDKDHVIHDDSSFRTLLIGENRVNSHAISAIQVSPDGNTVVIAIMGEFSPPHSQLLQTSLNDLAAIGSDPPISMFKPLTPIRWDHGRVHRMTHSPNGRHLAITLLGSEDSFWAEVWDLKDRQLVRVTETFLRAIDSIGFDSTGTKLGLGLTLPGLNSEGKPAKSGEPTATLARSEFRLLDIAADTQQTLPYKVERDVAFLKPQNPEAGNSWFVGHGGGALNIWQPDVVAPYRDLSGHRPKEVWDLACSGDGSTVFSVGDDHMLRAWDLASGVEKRFSSPRSSLVSCVAVSPDGRWVAAGGYDNDVVVYETESLNPVATLSGHTHDLRALAFSPDSQMLATGGRDRVIRLWSVPGFKLAGTREGHTNTVRALAWTTDGQLVSSGSDLRVLVWDSHGQVVHERTEPEGIHSLALAPAGLRLPVPTANAGASGVDFQTRLSPDSKEASDPNLMTVQSDELLALGMNHGAVRLWHLPTDKVFFEAQHHGVEIRSLAFSPDGRTLAVGGSEETVYLWHVATRRNVLTLDRLGSSVHRVAFSPDGTRLIAALHDGTIRIWHAPVFP